MRLKGYKFFIHYLWMKDCPERRSYQLSDKAVNKILKSIHPVFLYKYTGFP